MFYDLTVDKPIFKDGIQNVVRLGAIDRDNLTSAVALEFDIILRFRTTNGDIVGASSPKSVDYYITYTDLPEEVATQNYKCYSKRELTSSMKDFYGEDFREDSDVTVIWFEI